MSRGKEVAEIRKVSRDELIEWISLGTGRYGVLPKWLELWVHQSYGTSLEYLDNSQLSETLAMLWFHGGIPNIIRVGLDRRGRPTDLQWFYLIKASCLAGFLDIESRELRRFVKRIAKVDSPRFLTRAGATKVIKALETMLEQQNTQQTGE